MRAARVLLGLLALVACSDSKQAPTKGADASDGEGRDAAVPDDPTEPDAPDLLDAGASDASPGRDGTVPGDATPPGTPGDGGRLPPGPAVNVTPEGAGSLQFHGADVCVIDALGDIQCRNLAPVWKLYRKGPFKAMALWTPRGCGIAPDDSVSCWTDRYTSPGLCQGEVTSCIGEGQPPPEKFSRLSLFNQTACGVTLDGRLLCWGKDDDHRATPPGGNDFTGVTLAGDLSCALRRDGSAPCWAPYSNFGPSTFTGQGKQLAIGSGVACLLGSDGKVTCLGSSGAVARNPQAKDLAQISVERDAMCGLTQDGAARCWGGTGDAFMRVPPPVGPFKAIRNTTQYACGLRGDGQVECWGYFWGNGGGDESCLLNQGRLSIDGQAEAVVDGLTGFTDDRFPLGVGLRSSTSSEHGFVLLETASTYAPDLRALGADAGVVPLRSALFMLAGSDTAAGELYCAGPDGNGRVQRHGDELVLDFAELAVLGQCPGNEPVAGTISACYRSLPCATTALTGSLRGESKNVARRYETGGAITSKVGYTDGSILIAHEKTGQPAWGLLVLPPDASGLSEVLCAGSLTQTGGVRTFTNLTSLGRCKGAGPHTLKGCLR